QIPRWNRAPQIAARIRRTHGRREGKEVRGRRLRIAAGAEVGQAFSLTALCRRAVLRASGPHACLRRTAAEPNGRHASWNVRRRIAVSLERLTYWFVRRRMSGLGGRGWTNGKPRQASLEVIGFADARGVRVLSPSGSLLRSSPGHPCSMHTGGPLSL